MENKTKKVNHLPFNRISDNEVVVGTRTSEGIIISHIHRCPKSIHESSANNPSVHHSVHGSNDGEGFNGQ